MSTGTREDQLEASVKFLASELREVKKQVEMHTHHIEQIRRAVVSLNELMKKSEEINQLLEDIDGMKMRLNEIQAKEHRKFAGGGENKTTVEIKPASLDNME